jgi:large subunit ribosomal protein L29
MKREEIKKWRESTADEINLKISELENQLYKLRHQLHIGQLKNFSTVKNTRKDISVLKTLVSEKNLTGADKNGVKKNGKG